MKHLQLLVLSLIMSYSYYPHIAQAQNAEKNPTTEKSSKPHQAIKTNTNDSNSDQSIKDAEDGSFFQRDNPPAPEPLPLRKAPQPKAEPVTPRSMTSKGPQQPDNTQLITNADPSMQNDKTNAIPLATTKPKKFNIETGGYLRLKGRMMEADADAPEVGRNDGFNLADARLEIKGNYLKQLKVKLSLEAAIPNDSDVLNSPMSELRVGLKDAYVTFTMAGLNFTAGHFKPPYDAEQLTPTTQQFFINRSLESRGIAAGEGYQSRDYPSFATGRQLGLMVSSPQIELNSHSSLLLALAVTNGIGEVSANDNDLPAAYIRAAFSYNMKSKHPNSEEEGPMTIDRFEGFNIGATAYINPRTQGLLPDLYDELDYGAGLDFIFHMNGLSIGGQALGRITTFPTTEAQEIVALGGHAWGAYQMKNGIGLGYRFSYFDPTNRGEEFDVDRFMHHTISTRYQAATLPATFILEYTHALEQEALQVHNNRVEALLQVVF